MSELISRLEREADRLERELVAAEAERDVLAGQINELANFIMAEVPGEPARSEGAVDVAIRVIRALLPVVEGDAGMAGEDWRSGVPASRDVGPAGTRAGVRRGRPRRPEGGAIDLTEAIKAGQLAGVNAGCRCAMAMTVCLDCAAEAAVRAATPVIIERAVWGDAEEVWQVVYTDGAGKPVVWSECRDATAARESLTRARMVPWPNAEIRTRRVWHSDWEMIPFLTSPPGGEDPPCPGLT